jgi:hypothetical protein
MVLLEAIGMQLSRSTRSGSVHAAMQRASPWRLPATTRAGASTSFHVSAASSNHKLIEWISSNGGYVHPSLAISTSPFGYALRALSDIPEGSLLVSLPPSLQLSYSKALDPQGLMSLIDMVPKELWGAKLALKVLYERTLGEDSAFWPYIENLPVGFSGIPLFYTKNDIDALEYPPVSGQIVKRCRWVADYSNSAAVPGENIFGNDAKTVLSPNMIGWALSSVTSRAFRPKGEGSEAAMLPLIDMCNHSFDPNAKVAGSRTTDELSMSSLREIRAGEDVLLSYGNLPNDFLLLDYGFVVENNPYDTVKLAFDVSLVEAAKAVAGVGSALETDVKVPSWQRRALDRLGLSENKEVSLLWVEEEGDAPADERLLAGIRILCCPNERDLAAVELETLGKWNLGNTGAWETSTLKTLSGMCLIALSQFSSSATADRTLLDDPNTPSDMKLAVALRKEKKVLLTRALDAIKARLESGGQGIGNKKAKRNSKPTKSPNKGFGKSI